MIYYKNLIVSGSGFSAHGIGGVPPTENSEGGCSYIDDPDFPALEPLTWAGILAKKLQVTSLVNLSTDSGGNLLTSNVMTFGKRNTIVTIPHLFTTRMNL